MLNCECSDQVKQKLIKFYYYAVLVLRGGVWILSSNFSYEASKHLIIFEQRAGTMDLQMGLALGANS